MQRVPARPASVEESGMRPASRHSDKNSERRVRSPSTTQDPGGPGGKEGGSSHSPASDGWGIEKCAARPGMTGVGMLCPGQPEDIRAHTGASGRVLRGNGF